MKKFDPQIYPRKLYVLESEEDLKLFSNREGLELEVDQDTVASVWRVIEGGTGDLGVVVLFRRVGFDSIAHESDHIANCIFDDLGIDLGYTHDEHHAYMIGWVAKCIGEALGLTIVKEERR